MQWSMSGRDGAVASAFSKPKPDDKTEDMYQIERFHSFIWASGGLFSDFYIHQIDETSWMKNAWPIKAHAVGGRHYRGDFIDQNMDTYSVEYTYEDGSKLFFDGRTMLGCNNKMSSVVHGSKGSAYVSMSGHKPGKVRTFKGQNQVNDDIVWKYPQPEENPYQLEWDDLIDAIVNDKPYNEIPRGVEASLVTSMPIRWKLTIRACKICKSPIGAGRLLIVMGRCKKSKAAALSGSSPLSKPGKFFVIHQGLRSARPLV